MALTSLSHKIGIICKPLKNCYEKLRIYKCGHNFENPC